MTTFLKLLLGVAIDALIKRIPTFVAAWEKLQAERAARAKLAADKAKIDDFVKASADPDQP